MTPRVYRGYTRRPEMSGGKQSPLRHGVIDPDLVPPEVGARLAAVREKVLGEPFRGLTTDGTVLPGLYDLRPGTRRSAAADAAAAFLESLDERHRASATHPLDSDERRLWTNAFPVWEPAGVCLDTLSRPQRDAAMAIVATCLSPDGFVQTRTAMKLNEALGELIDTLRDTLREWMYWLTIFGDPMRGEPWGWQLMGHHIALNCLLVDGHMVMTPTFLGAEPTEIEEGPYTGLRIFDDERDRGLDLVNALTSAQLERAVLFPSMLHADLPPEYDHPSEGRHRGGAGRDNAVVPYEGIAARDLTTSQRQLLMRVIEAYASRLPPDDATARLENVTRHLDEAHFCWIGTTSQGSPFYYKVHSPVIWIEFDCHRGVFLDNDEAQPFHVHTIVRTPNGNDYGTDLLRQHRARFHASASGRA